VRKHPLEDTIVRLLTVTIDETAYTLHDAWGVVISNSPSRYFLLVHVLVGHEQPPLDGSKHNLISNGWEFDDGEYLVASEDEVPDEVWVELAKFRLVGAE
jgi:hypothetical protein